MQIEREQQGRSLAGVWRGTAGFSVRIEGVEVVVRREAQVQQVGVDIVIVGGRLRSFADVSIEERLMMVVLKRRRISGGMRVEMRTSCVKGSGEVHKYMIYGDRFFRISLEFRTTTSHSKIVSWNNYYIRSYKHRSLFTSQRYVDRRISQIA